MSEAVRGMFDRIAARYDRTNSVLSLGQHRRWRRRLVRWTGAKPGDRVLDVATGTGDLAFEFARRVGERGEVVGVDFSQEMLLRARAKRTPYRNVRFERGDALRLAYEDGTFDIASIAFGIRNVDDPRRGLAELARVVKVGGRVAVLEFGRPRWWMRGPYHVYARWVLPRLGGRLAGDRQAYEYLRDTSARFPSGPEFLALMDATGRFSSVEWRRLSGGVVHAYIGVVRSPQRART